MSRKLVCVRTGNWSYCSEDRYQKLVAKYGSEDKLRAEYVSRTGKKLTEGAAAPDSFKNKIRCTVTGVLCYISDARLASLVAKKGSEQAVREGYISRVAARLLKAGKTNDEIKQMADAGTLPPPAAAPGTPKAIKPPSTGKRGRKPKIKDEPIVIDNVPADQSAETVIEPAQASEVTPA